MPLFCADASALVKLVRDEPESDALRAFLAGADLVSCELVLAEVPSSIRRAGVHDPELPGVLLDQAALVLETLGLLPLDRPLPGSPACAPSRRGPDRRRALRRPIVEERIEIEMGDVDRSRHELREKPVAQVGED